MTMQDMISIIVPVYNAGNYIEDHLHERLSVDDIAKHVSLSESYFRSSFKKTDS